MQEERCPSVIVGNDEVQFNGYFVSLLLNEKKKRQVIVYCAVRVTCSHACVIRSCNVLSRDFPCR